MNILEQIIANKQVEIARAQNSISIDVLMATDGFERKCNSLASALKNQDSTNIIAEYKRKSPSKGEINMGAGISETTQAYVSSGAVGLSILTDTVYFGGFADDLKIARRNLPNTPLLRKDFIVDPYQLYEAKAWGADVVLLIAANLSPQSIKSLSNTAHDLGLEVLLEVHDKEEIESSDFKNIDVVGVNNRNLKNFAENNVNASLELFQYLPTHIPQISESCISDAVTVNILKKAGYKGFLIGENFMKTNNPGQSLKQFLHSCDA